MNDARTSLRLADLRISEESSSTASAPGQQLQLPQQQHHMRRTSEPLDETPSDLTGLLAQEGEGSESSLDRRQLFERHWSTSNLNSTNTAVRGLGARPSSSSNCHLSGGATAGRSGSSRNFDFMNSVADIHQFHQSWANTNGSDLFGASSSAVLGASMASLGGSGAGDFTSTSLEIPPMSSRRTSVSPRVDSSSLIHDAARITDWDRVLELCHSHPDYAKYTGGDGWTSLHHACNRRCPRPAVVEALIQAYPDALSTEEEKGWLPLHYACRFKAPKEVVHLLLHLYPDKGREAVSKKDRQGRPPLYYAIRYDAPPGVVGLLLAVNPAAVLEADQHDESPLALVWDNWAEKLEARRTIQTFLSVGFSDSDNLTEQQRTDTLRHRLSRQTKLLKRWRQVNVLLKAAFGFPVEEASWDAMDLLTDTPVADSGRKWRIVHAAAAIKCHLSLFLLACALHPEQARELDESDLRHSSGDPMLTARSTHQTALHFAATSSVNGEAGKTVVHRLLSLYREAAHIQDAVDGSLPLHLMVENKHKLDWANHAAILYHVYPRAVQIPDHLGRLPLHRAAAAITHEERDEEYFETSVIVNIVRNFPQAASRADNSGCLPFHHLALNANVWDDEVEAVYNANRGVAQARTGASLESRLPLHLAASRKESQVSLVNRLLQMHPRGASAVDRQGKLPLHLACEVGKEWADGLGAIHESFPAGIQQGEANDRGWLASHIVAANHGSSTTLLEKIVEVYPQGVSIADNRGNYPLHLACESGKLWASGLGTFFEAGPGIQSVANHAGLLPFHIVMLKYCGGEEPSKPPEQEAAELECMFQLLRADPTVIA